MEAENINNCNSAQLTFKHNVSDASRTSQADVSTFSLKDLLNFIRSDVAKEHLHEILLECVSQHSLNMGATYYICKKGSKQVYLSSRINTLDQETQYATRSELVCRSCMKKCKHGTTVASMDTYCQTDRLSTANVATITERETDTNNDDFPALPPPASVPTKLNLPVAMASNAETSMNKTGVSIDIVPGTINSKLPIDETVPQYLSLIINDPPSNLYRTTAAFIKSVELTESIIARITPLRHDNQLKLTAHNTATYIKLEKFLKTNNIPYKLLNNAPTKFTKVVITGVPASYGCESLQADLLNLGFQTTSVTNMNTRKFGEPRPTSSWLINLADDKLLDRIMTLRTLSYCSVRVSLYNAPLRPLQCRKCWRFGHTMASCMYESRCKICADPSHLHASCPNNNAPLCCNCGKSHLATDPTCPQYGSRMMTKLQNENKLAQQNKYVSTARREQIVNGIRHCQARTTGNGASYASVISQNSSNTNPPVAHTVSLPNNTATPLPANIVTLIQQATTSFIQTLQQQLLISFSSS